MKQNKMTVILIIKTKQSKTKQNKTKLDFISVYLNSVFIFQVIIISSHNDFLDKFNNNDARFMKLTGL